MGRPARNHGGTGGHGCHPLPGERPNFNHHVISDKTHDENHKRVHSESPSNFVSHMGPRRISSDRPDDSASMKVPKRVENDSQIDTVSMKQPNGGHCDSPGIKEPNQKV